MLRHHIFLNILFTIFTGATLCQTTREEAIDVPAILEIERPLVTVAILIRKEMNILG